MTEMKRRVLVVEDEPMVRGLLSSMLESCGFDAFTAGDVAAARAVFADVDPDAVLVDVELGPGPTGLDLVAGLLPEHPGLGVIFLTRVPDARFVGRRTPKLRPNVAWVRKQDLLSPEYLTIALDRVLRATAGPELRADLDRNRPLARLSSGQIEVLRLVAAGLSNEEIARERGTTVRAVESLIFRAFAACGIEAGNGNPRVQAVRLIASQAALPS